MSLTRYVDITCDDCGEDMDDGDIDARGARERARENGWRTNLPGSRDLCPQCRPRPHRPAP